jgi:hypothetical protein
VSLTRQPDVGQVMRSPVNGDSLLVNSLGAEAVEDGLDERPVGAASSGPLEPEQAVTSVVRSSAHARR